MPAAQRGPVTGLAKLAGIIILVFGLIWTALGALITLTGGAVKLAGDSAGVSPLGDAFGGAIAGFGIIILIIAVVELVAGIGVLMSKEWGRIIGIAYALIFGFGSIFIVLGGIGAMGDSSATNGGAVTLVIGLAFVIGYLFSLFALGVRWRGRA